MDLPSAPLRVADLFCGAGGLSQGFKEAGFEIVLGLDRDKDSCETFELNHPGAVVVRKSITDVPPEQFAQLGGPIDVIVGGPSCQGFSTAGRLGRLGRDAAPDAERWVRPDDVRNDLWRHMLKVVEAVRPRAFLLENVPGLVYWKQGSLGETVLQAFEALGYAVDLKILLAADFGVPQRRRRLFVVGVLGDEQFQWPAETHMGGWRRDTLHFWEARRIASGKLPHISCWEAIRDLPPQTAGAPASASYGGRASTSPIATWLRRRNRVLRDHESAPLSDDHRRLLEWVPRGGTWRDIPPHLLPDRFRGMRRTDSTNLYGRLDPSRPAYTINTQFENPSTGCYTHPFEDRALTIREGARLQTFPDTYTFVGTLTSRCRQIGNAVPPLLAATLANALADQLLNGATPVWRVSIKPILPATRPPTARTSARMVRQRRADTGPEIAVRRALHARGLRYRKGFSALTDRRSIDIAFPSLRIAVFIDGCFWHGCPTHERPTKSNTLWWAEKIARNKQRDGQTNLDLEARGWLVLRFWEHEEPERIADAIAQAVTDRRQQAA